MMYPFMTLDDGTEIVHSEILNIDGKEKVKYILRNRFTWDSNQCSVICPIMNGVIMMDLMNRKWIIIKSLFSH